MVARYAETMTALDLQNWISLYLATAMCCGFAIVLTTLTVASDMYRERVWLGNWNASRMALFVPRTWWRWQRRYFMSTPMTLGIVSAYALSLSW
jgi:hypothetical protein